MIDKLNEMWEALAAYQDKADADGHGESWALMCSEKTKATANEAYWCAVAGDDACSAACRAAGNAALAAEAAAWDSSGASAWAVSAAADNLDYHTQLSINNITKAQGNEMTKHKHYEAIMAYANGAAIELKGEISGKWDEIAHPSWVECLTYRVKPTPKPDIVHEVLIVCGWHSGPLLYAASASEANCVLVFDGETNKLKGCTFKAA